jgi:hypothetical protein
MDKIILITENNNEISLSKEASKQSKLLNTLIEDLPEGNQPIFSFHNIKYDIAKKIVDFLEYYNKNKPKETNRVVAIYDFESEMSNFDKEYTNIDINTIIDLIHAANFFEIKSLIELLTTKLDSLMMRKNPEEIYKNLPKNDDNKHVNEQDLFNEIF